MRCEDSLLIVFNVRVREFESEGNDKRECD